MAKKQPFFLIYDEEYEKHLKAIEPKYFSLIRDTIVEQLEFEPNVPTKNRKRLQPPGILGAEWEIRFGPGNRFRVFYEVDVEGNEVHIYAIAVKKRDQLFVGEKELET